MDARQFRRVFPSYNFTDHYEGICKTVEYYKKSTNSTPRHK